MSSTGAAGIRGELRHVADRHVPDFRGEAEPRERSDVTGAVIPDLAALEEPEIGRRTPEGRLVDLFEVVDDRSRGQDIDSGVAQEVGTENNRLGAGH